MKILIAIVGLLCTMSGQLSRAQDALHEQMGEVTTVLSESSSAGPISFSLVRDCSKEPAHWALMRGTIVLDQKIVHEVWVKVDPCRPQGSAAIFCRNGAKTALSIEPSGTPRLTTPNAN